MQEIINAMLKAILQDANQQKPITYSVKRGNDLFVEFHSGYMFEFKEGMIDITNVETGKKERIRDGVNAKLSVEVLKMLKDWLNKDFNSGIVIEDDTEESSNATKEEEGGNNSEGDNNEGETEGEEKEDSKSEKAKSTKKLPGWAAAQKK